MVFKRILCITALLAAGGCSYLIPESESSPRYTTVLGDRHAPKLNQESMQNAGAAPVAPVAAQEIQPIDSAAFPPVDAATQARAQQEIATQNPPPAAPAETRQVPVENRPIGVAANDTPAFSSVPPRPAMSGPASDEEQLNVVRAQLERDRAAADAAHGQLSRDAAGEPSLLPASGAVPAPLPPTTVMAPPSALPPATIPNQVGPSSGLDNTRSANAAPAMDAAPAPMAPMPAPAASSFVAPAPLMPPPPAPMAPLPPVATNEVPMPPPVAAMPGPAPSPTPAMEPIVLRPPAAQPMPAAAPTAEAPRFAPAPAQNYSSMAPTSSGFDPMATGSGASYAASSTYLPSSRYTR